MCIDNEDLVWIVVLVLILIILYFICNNKNSSTPVNFNSFFDAS